jgi:hypothetical protein
MLLLQWLAIIANQRGLPRVITLDGFQSLFQPIDPFQRLLGDLQQPLTLGAIGSDGRHVHDQQRGRLTTIPPSAIPSQVNKYRK